MRKIILVVICLLNIQAIQSQTLIGVNIDVASSKIVTGFNYNLTPERIVGGNCFGAGVSATFNTSKRFNPKLNLGFVNKKSVSIREISYYAADANGNPTSNLVTENLTTTTSIDGLKLDVGVRFNALNNKNKIFLEASICNNYVLDIKSRSNTIGLGNPTFYTTIADPRYYVSLPLGVGYSYNNMFSIAFIYNPSITYFNAYQQSRVNMYGLNLCYYLPILGNKKVNENTTTTSN